jgi:RimJ/RimL family protein N-acetyltransferase
MTITLRPATAEDADLLLGWRNDPATLAASHTTTAVSRDDHLAWLSRVLADGSRRLFIAEEDGRPVGTVRADKAGGVHTLSWTVAPDARRRGVAGRMVALFAGMIAEPLRADVKADNIASHRVAERAGMTVERRTDGIVYYRRPAVTPG